MGARGRQGPARSALRDATWRPSHRQLARLIAGLVLFGAGEALLVLAALGNSPWTVLAAGVANQTGLKIGTATILISVAVLLVWIPLRERPGFGTIANALVIGLVIDGTLALVATPSAPALRVLFVAAGIALVGLGSGLYINAALGRGPRDGLMTAIHHHTGRSIALVRTVIEVGVLVAGVALGGLFGPATVAFALLIGPSVHMALRLLPAGAPAG
ncbi:MAG TPA: hypothetical protein VMT10_13695 [Solirubrobacteraceae bacterium]|nr:hypothetical protein [Solirubrobacteraceae bacterium]